MPNLTHRVAVRYIEAMKPARVSDNSIMLPGVYAEGLFRKFGGDNTFPAPIRCWFVENDHIKQLDIVKVRGPLDRERSSAAWAVEPNQTSHSTFYMWPVQGYKRPELIKIKDQYGETGQWVAVKKGFEVTEQPVEVGGIY